MLHNEAASTSMLLVTIPPQRIAVSEGRDGGTLADFVPRPFHRTRADLRVVRPMYAPMHYRQLSAGIL